MTSHAYSAEQRFELLVGAVSDYALYMLDPQGRVTTWNKGAERAKGYQAGEIIGEHFSRFFTADDQAADLPARILRIAAREGRYETEGWRVRKDGSLYCSSSVIEPIRADDGMLLGFAKISRDITERKEAERAVRESERRFQLLVQGVKDCAIYMLDPQGIITNWNTGAQAIKGYDADEIVGKHFSIFYTEDDRVAGIPAKALGIAREQGKYENEAWRVRKDGSLFWANVLIDTIVDEAGELIGFAKITRDVTDRKRVSEELEETRAALLQSQKLQAIGELTGGVAHDFNNLLTVIAAATDMMVQQPDMEPARRQRYLDAIGDTIKRATKLTGHLLAFSRRRVLRPEVLDLNMRLDALSEVLARSLGSRYVVEVKPTARDARVEVDPTELETAILNATVNARDAMPDGGQLTIETRNATHQRKPMIRIDITDTGSGMPKDLIERAFEPFFTTKAVGEGTGLGLSQIHGFAAQAGGVAELSSREGKGTTLRILLPQVDKELADEEKRTAPKSVPQGLRVLLVEDNPHVLNVAAQLLADMGSTVTSAHNGDEALAALEGQAFDLIFSDVVMPGMTGLDLAQRVKESHPELPVLLATGYSKQVMGTSCANPVITKPYGRQSLSTAIAELLASKDGGER